MKWCNAHACTLSLPSLVEITILGQKNYTHITKFSLHVRIIVINSQGVALVGHRGIRTECIVNLFKYRPNCKVLSPSHSPFLFSQHNEDFSVSFPVHILPFPCSWIKLQVDTTTPPYMIASTWTIRLIFSSSPPPPGGILWQHFHWHPSSELHCHFWHRLL